MKLQIQLFAAAKQAAGCELLEVDVDDDVDGAATIAAVRQAVVARAPALSKIVAHARWAVDAEFAGDACQVTEQSEIALIPPVSGG